LYTVLCLMLLLSDLANKFSLSLSLSLSATSALDAGYSLTSRGLCVCLCVCVSVIARVSHAKTAEPIEMPFGWWMCYMEVDTNATWRIRLNNRCSAASSMTETL